MLLSQVLFLVQLYISIWAQESCSSKCVCKANSQKDSGNFVKMTCGDTEKITHLDELELLNIANELVQL